MSPNKICRLCLRNDENAESLLPNLSSDIMAVKAVTEIFNIKVRRFLFTFAPVFIFTQPAFVHVSFTGLDRTGGRKTNRLMQLV